APDCVEKMSEEQRSEHISQCERQQIAAHILLGHIVEAHQNQCVCEKDRVVKKSLREHQHKTKKRSATMLMYDGVPNFVPGRMCACSNPRWLQVAVAKVAGSGTLRHNPLFYFADDAFCLVIAAMNHQPARTFRNPSTKKDHNQTKRCADS